MSIDLARQALQKALTNNGQLAIKCESKKEAISFRFSLYQARKSIKKELAKYEGGDIDDVITDYCGLEFSLVERDGDYIVQIGVQPKVEMFDPTTGETL